MCTDTFLCTYAFMCTYTFMYILCCGCGCVRGVCSGRPFLAIGWPVRALLLPRVCGWFVSSVRLFYDKNDIAFRADRVQAVTDEIASIPRSSLLARGRQTFVPEKQVGDFFTFIYINITHSSWASCRTKTSSLYYTMLGIISQARCWLWWQSPRRLLVLKLISCTWYHVLL